MLATSKWEVFGCFATLKGPCPSWQGLGGVALGLLGPMAGTLCPMQSCHWNSCQPLQTRSFWARKLTTGAP
jgi:hypothetical protein